MTDLATPRSSHDAESQGVVSESTRLLLDRIVALSIGLRAAMRELSDITNGVSSTLQDLEILVLLEAAPGSRPVGWNQLQRRLVLTSGALAHRLAKMEEAGLIRRTRIPSDRRQVMVEATEEGLDDLQSVVRDLTPSDLTDALSLVERRLSRLLAALDGAA